MPQPQPLSFAIAVLAFGALWGCSPASALQITKAGHENGRLIVEGKTAQKNQMVELEGRFTTKSGKSRKFMFSVVHYADDCVVNLQAGRKVRRAVVADCGRRGERGRRGPRGFAGADGPPGPDGRDGQDGQDGAPGLQGQRGDVGLPGQPGREGTAGVLAQASEVTQICSNTVSGTWTDDPDNGKVHCVAACRQGEGIYGYWLGTTGDLSSTGDVTLPAFFSTPSTTMPANQWLAFHSSPRLEGGVVGSAEYNVVVVTIFCVPFASFNR